MCSWKKNALVHLGLNIEEIKGMLMNFESDCRWKENSASRILDFKRICRWQKNFKVKSGPEHFSVVLMIMLCNLNSVWEL